jgi:succinate dehydrogenase/fumarate reductase-like Fe-S protein
MRLNDFGAYLCYNAIIHNATIAQREFCREKYCDSCTIRLNRGKWVNVKVNMGQYIPLQEEEICG